MADYAFLKGLSGRQDWNTIRAEKQNEMQQLAAVNSMRQEQSDKQAMLQNQLNEYQSTLDELEITPIGKDRINERVNEPLKEAIAQKIKKYGGDLETYMKVEGATDMNNYLKTLINHPETQRELTNASNISKWRADKMAGLEERLTFDPNTGGLSGSFSDNLDKYLNGESETLDYKGAFKPVGFDEKIFGSMYGSKNRYESKPVTAEDYASMAYRGLIEKGASEEDAAQESFVLAKNYREAIKNGDTPLRWKSDKWTAPSGWGAAEEQANSAKYIAERFGKLVKDDNSEIWDEIDVTMPSLEPRMYDQQNGGWLTPDQTPQVSKKSSALNGLKIGKYTQRFTRKNPTTGIEEEYFTPVENEVTGVASQNGKVYIQTTQGIYEDEQNGGGTSGYKELTDNTIDELALGAKDPAKAASALRKTLSEMGVYKDGIINFGGKKKPQPPMFQVQQSTPQVSKRPADNTQTQSAPKETFDQYIGRFETKVGRKATAKEIEYYKAKFNSK